MKILRRICISTIIAAIFLFLSFAIWYFFLLKLPDTPVIGTAAPIMTREDGYSLMRYHGIKIAYIKDGQWVFDRDGKTIPLIRR